MVGLLFSMGTSNIIGSSHVRTRPAKSEKRFGQRRKSNERRAEIRWEPDKPARRGASHGRRREDGWDPGKRR